MSIEITWRITNTMHYENGLQAGFICNVMWACVGVDSESGVTESVASGAELSIPKSGVPSIDYEDVTEVEILNWLFDSGAIDPDVIENSVTEKFIQTRVWGGLPWVKPKELEIKH